jgi:hypothetical protein
MNLFELLFTTKYDDRINSFYSSLEKLITLDYQKLFASFIEKIEERAKNYTKEQKESCDRWVEYGWVPMLPNSEKGDGIAKLAPQTSNEADEFMLSKLDEDGLKLLYTNLKQYIDENELNCITFDNAISCFENEQYTACTLCLFALIDSIFITKQEKNKDVWRKLANKAVETANNYKDVNLAPLKVTYELVRKLFENAEDFSNKYNNKLNRNMISHGMNTRNPDKIDCIKLFVLLYNVLLSFKAGLFSFDN